MQRETNKHPPLKQNTHTVAHTHARTYTHCIILQLLDIRRTR